MLHIRLWCLIIQEIKKKNTSKQRKQVEAGTPQGKGSAARDQKLAMHLKIAGKHGLLLQKPICKNQERQVKGRE
jgi:hypothetical protein